jgi:hypothetical protein
MDLVFGDRELNNLAKFKLNHEFNGEFMGFSTVLN